MKKSSKNSKKNIGRIEKVEKTVEKIDTIRETIGKVDSTNKVISDTLYIKDNIAVDIKNFSLMSIPSSKELFNQ